MFRRPFSLGLLMGCAALLSCMLVGCTTHHWAEVKASELPPPPGPKVVHTGDLLIHVLDATDRPQCLRRGSYRPVCYSNVRPAIESGLARSLWPAYPRVRSGRPEDATPGDYVLEVDLGLDALPPDADGPGWSAGVRGRYRLLRDGKVLTESTLAARSRAEFPYGAPLGTGATEAMDAALWHIAEDISALPESRPDEPLPLPPVATRKINPTGAAGAQKTALQSQR